MINTSLSEFKKNDTNPLVFKQKLAEFKHSKQLTIDIYTNGSKDGNKVASAAIVDNDIFQMRQQYLQLKLKQLNLLSGI